MAYTMVDLVEKLIEIEQNGFKFYMGLTALDNISEKVKTAAKVFAWEEVRHMEVLKELRDSIKGELEIQVDFGVYNKASILVVDFVKSHSKADVQEVQKLLGFALNFEKENVALLLSVRGSMVKSKSDKESKNYKIISGILDEEQKHVRNIEMLMKK